MAGRPCKICQLEKTHPEAYRLITEEISQPKGEAKIKPLLKTLKERFNLNINSQNIHRHKGHSDIEGGARKPNTKTEQRGIQKGTVRTGAFISESSNTITFQNVDSEHIQFLSNYRQNGYRNKEKAWTEAGFKSPKKVYEVMERPEIQAALYELKAADFINLRVTGNQIIAGIGKIAIYPEYFPEACDKDGVLKTNIKEWPEGLQCALSGVEITEDALQGEEDELILRRKFKFKFESHLRARQELRKHFMEIDLYRMGEEKRQIHERSIAIMEMRKEEDLNLTETMKLFEAEGLPFPESLKLEIKDFDWELEKRIKKAEENANEALRITSGNQ